MLALNARLAALLTFAALLMPAAAMAQARAWTVATVVPEGEDTAVVVMDEESALTFEVTNTSTNINNRITQVSFVLPNNYGLLDGEPDAANPNWRVSEVDGVGRRITFESTIGCNQSAPGLARNEKARFTVRMVAPANANDVTGERITTASYARYHCTSNTNFSPNYNAATWSRVGLSAQVTVLPRALTVGGDATARIVIENRTNQAKGAVTAEGPNSAGGVTFNVVGLEPSSFQVPLPLRGAGILNAYAQPTSSGIALAQVRATGGNFTSPLADALMVNVRPLAAVADVDTLQAFTGEQATVRLTVVNTSTTDTFLDVRPRTPVLVGKATATLVSGPTPASVPRLKPGASAQFIWRYQLTGAARADYTFRLQADATRNGGAVSTDLVDSAKGSIVTRRVLISPDAVSASSTNRTMTYTVQNRGTTRIREVKLLRPATNFFSGFVAGTPPTGWRLETTDATGYTWVTIGNPDSSTVGILPGREASFTMTYSSFGAVTQDTAFRHRLELNQGDNDPRIRVEAPVTLLSSGTAPEVEQLTGVARDGSVTLTWDNPSDHGGVVVLRATGAAPNTVPTPGLRYAVGATLGNAQVVYADTYSPVSTFTDSTVTNGTSYVYRVFNATDARKYSAGNAPTSAGLSATPRARGVGDPLWCYSVGLDARLQPITELGVGIFSSFNDSVVASSTVTGNPATDGAERWRPVKLSGLVGSRFSVVPLHGLPGQYILVGDQVGVPSAINTATGDVLWSGANIGAIQSFPVTQLYDYANAAYRSAHPNRDLVFFATRLSNPAQNQIVALNAATGALVWRYQPGNLGMVSGGMLVDYTSNRLYVGSKTATGATDTLRVLNSLTGAEVARRAVGDIESGVVRNSMTGQILVTSSEGTVYGIDPVTLVPAWTAPIASRPTPSTPAFTSFVRPLGRGFVASLASGRVERYELDTNNLLTRVWSTPIANPSGVFSLNLSGVARIYVGSSDGKVHQLALEDGVDSRQVAIGGAQGIGTPTIDHTVNRLHVGTQDGRICAFPVPFN